MAHFLRMAFIGASSGAAFFFMARRFMPLRMAFAAFFIPLRIAFIAFMPFAMLLWSLPGASFRGAGRLSRRISCEIA